jgi:beta-glucosidase-like glycosyl hydrolase
MDGTTEKDGEHHDRNHVDSKISMQDLVDSYLKPFQSCVEKGRVSSLMCSYNAINGVPSCANNWLLQEVARDNWNFDGYITSDCDADSDVFNSHHFTKTAEEAVRDVLRAGTDVDCGGFVSSNVMSALNKSVVTMKDIDERLKMLFRVRMRLSHFDPPGPLDSIQTSEICSDYSIALSQDGVKQSAVLIKNELNALPLDKAKVGTVAVIGPTATLSKADAGYYGPSNVCGGNFWTLVDALASGGLVKTNTTPGVPDVLSNDESGIPAAVEMAREADTVVLAVGTDLSWAAEGHDAKNISFTDAQSALIQQVAAAAKKPVIVVVQTATPLDLSAVLANPKVGAVLHVGQPSVTILGVGDILYGVNSPAGRMVQTVYPSAYQDQISIFDFGMRPGTSPFARPDCTEQDPTKCPRGTNPGRTYRFYTGKPVVPFGFGLSYTSWKYSVASPATNMLSLEAVRTLLASTAHRNRTFIRAEDESVAWQESNWPKYAVQVENTGSVDADDIVLGFITPPGAGQNGTPLQTLFGFERVHVKAGQTATVWLYPGVSDFTKAAADGQFRAITGTYKVRFGLAQSAHLGMGYAEAADLVAF